MTKKISLILGVIFSVLFFLSAYQKNMGLCGSNYNQCWKVADILWPVFLFGLPVFLLTLVSYRMNDQVLQSWWHFAYWWIPISVLFIVTTPSVNHSWAVSFGPKPETVMLIASALFFAISLVIIVYKSYSLRGK
jgi:hypothetical protein